MEGALGNEGNEGKEKLGQPQLSTCPTGNRASRLTSSAPLNQTIITRLFAIRRNRWRFSWKLGNAQNKLYNNERVLALFEIDIGTGCTILNAN